MQGYNVILLYDKNIKQLLMCKRRNNPYIGLNNLIGGKIEHGECGLHAAYRELLEEADVSKDAVNLVHVMDFKYHLSGCSIEVYAGKLKYDVTVSGDENELFWADLDANFFDTNQFAGEGNIGHMVEQVKIHAECVWGDSE